VLSSQRGELYGLVPEGKALFAAVLLRQPAKAGLGYAIAGLSRGRRFDQSAGTGAGHSGGGGDQRGDGGSGGGAKRREIASAELQKNSVSGLAMAWSQAVAIEGRQSPDDDIAAIRRVTVADVNRVAPAVSGL
jgi:zinc protease